MVNTDNKVLIHFVEPDAGWFCTKLEASDITFYF